MIVLDASFLIAYHNTRDVHHAAAARIMVQLVGGTWGPALLPEYVFLEVVTVLRAKRGIEVANAAARALLAAGEVEFVPCSPFFHETLSVFHRQGEAGLSFADCAIVALARRHGPGHVATFDAGLRGVRGVSVVAA